jgi:hypothetical protein
MIEVFKTNVKDPAIARRLVSQIHRAFNGYKANFDLWDCDNILRVKCPDCAVDASRLIEFLKESGFEAQVLPDDGPSSDWIQGKVDLKYRGQVVHAFHYSGCM